MYEKYNKYLKENINIEENNIIIKELNKTLIPEYNKINKYSTINNFSDLFSEKRKKEEALRKYLELLMQKYGISSQDLSKILQSTTNNIFSKDRRQIQRILSNMQVNNQPQQPIASQNVDDTQLPKQDVALQGQKYDASNIWSPMSLAGKVYEWNRGVIGISYDGEVEKENLDGTNNHHADATYRVSQKLGVNIPLIIEPFQAGLNAIEQGLVILQTEGDNCFVYFPQVISEEQLDKIKASITPRKDFNFSFIHGEEIFEDVPYDIVINYATQLAASLAQATPRVAR